MNLENHENASAIIINMPQVNPVMHSLGFDNNFGNNSHKIIWNFHNANQLNFTVGIKGSVLAPNALLMMENGHIDGNVIVNGLIIVIVVLI